jgi:hypothetical protein
MSRFQIAVSSCVLLIYFDPHELTVRWDPTCTDELVFHQATNLHLAYHQVQIAVHQPLILDTMHPSATASSALAICSSAARSTSRLMNAHFKRRQQSLPLYTVCSQGIQCDFLSDIVHSML